MKRAFLFTDDKSLKFWTIHQEGTELVVNYGKQGATGKYQVKCFDREDECVKQADKLIAQKLKKGYRETQDFDFENRLYFDDEEVGPHPLTSHPRFAAHFADTLFYSCDDEEGPFGSDEGSDTLAILQERLRKRPTLEITAFPKELLEEWGLEYIPAAGENEEQLRALLEEKSIHVEQTDMVTYATAFAQIKITGSIDEKLRRSAIASLRRFSLTAKIEEWGESDIQQQLITSLDSYQNPG